MRSAPLCLAITRNLAAGCTDQRGVARPRDAGCYIGAFER